MSLDIYLNVVAETEVYTANITHNLGKMAKECGIYYQLWRPEEIGVSFAGDLIKPLEQGLFLLKSQPDIFKKLEPENGWGNYESFIVFVTKYLEACRENPEAKIVVSR